MRDSWGALGRVRTAASSPAVAAGGFAGGFGDMFRVGSGIGCGIMPKTRTAGAVPHLSQWTPAASAEGSILLAD